MTKFIYKRLTIATALLGISFSIAAKPSTHQPIKQFIPLDKLVSQTRTPDTSGSKKADIQYVNAMKEQALDTGISNGYLFAMGKIVKAMLKHHELFDHLLPFQEIVDFASGNSAVEGRYIIPGIVTEINDSEAIDNVECLPFSTLKCRVCEFD